MCKTQDPTHLVFTQEQANRASAIKAHGSFLSKKMCEALMHCTAVRLANINAELTLIYLLLHSDCIILFSSLIFVV